MFIWGCATDMGNSGIFMYCKFASSSFFGEFLPFWYILMGCKLHIFAKFQQVWYNDRSQICQSPPPPQQIFGGIVIAWVRFENLQWHTPTQSQGEYPPPPPPPAMIHT